MVTCIRFPDGVSDELSTDYDLLLLSQAVTYNDGSSGAATYCSPAAGNLPAKLRSAIPGARKLSESQFSKMTRVNRIAGN